MILDLKRYERFFSLLDEPSEMADFRQRLKENLGDSVELPKYRYSSFVKLPLPDFEISEIKDAPDCKIAVDAPDQVSVHDSLTSENSSRFLRASEKDLKDSMDAVHSSYMNSVLMLDIPDGVSLDRPIVVDVDAGGDTVFLSVYIRAGKDSSSKVVIKRKSSDACPFFSSRTHVNLESGAVSDIIDVQDLSMETIGMSKTFVHSDDSASVKASGICLGGKYAKSDFFSILDGKGSASELRVLNLATGKRKHNIHAESIHNASGTYSDIFTKAVISDRAKALATGNVCIGAEASDSNGYETQNALLLTENAEADAIPNLEIHNHDVKCSHGSTISQIDENQVFYMMSRGVSRKNAELMLIKGFFNNILEKIGDEAITHSAYEKIEAMLSRKYDEEHPERY